MYEVDGEQQRLKITVLRQEHKDDAEIIGEGYVVIDGTWKDNEFDGESLRALCCATRRARSAAGERAPTADALHTIRMG